MEAEGKTHLERRFSPFSEEFVAIFSLVDAASSFEGVFSKDGISVVFLLNIFEEWYLRLSRSSSSSVLWDTKKSI